MPLLHIIIPVLNNIDMTKETIGSIDSPVPFAIHVMDQESTDGTQQWCEAEHDKTKDWESGKLWYHRLSPRVSLSEAWNRGIIEALSDESCQYLLFPNNDIHFHSKTIKELMVAIDTLGYLMVTAENVAPRMTLIDMLANDSLGNSEFDAKPIENWREEGPDFSCFMVKRDFVSKIGWFDEHFFPAYCEDQDCHARIVLGGYHAKRITKAPYYHYASQTVARNGNLAGWIIEGHNRNKGYYREKWGADHGGVLDRIGYKTPFNRSDVDIKFWEGNEKYNHIKL